MKCAHLTNWICILWSWALEVLLPTSWYIVYWCLLMFIDVYWCLLMFIDVYCYQFVPHVLVPARLGLTSSHVHSRFARFFVSANFCRFLPGWPKTLEVAAAANNVARLWRGSPSLRLCLELFQDANHERKTTEMPRSVVISFKIKKHKAHPVDTALPANGIWNTNLLCPCWPPESPRRRLWTLAPRCFS